MRHGAYRHERVRHYARVLHFVEAFFTQLHPSARRQRTVLARHASNLHRRYQAAFKPSPMKSALRGPKIDQVPCGLALKANDPFTSGDLLQYADVLKIRFEVKANEEAVE